MTTRKPSTIEDYAERYRSAKWVAEDFRADLVAVVRECHAAGWSELELARRAGVTRQTIRHWLGKGSHAMPGK